MVPSTYEDGTLYNVLPSGNKAPDETGNHNGYDQTRADFTFSRGSNLSATRINSDGLIEKGRENLLLQSNQFDTSPWGLDGSTITGGQLGYDGSNNAWLFTKTGSFDGLNQGGLSVSGVSTISIYAKIPTGETDANAVLFRIDDSSGNSIVAFNLTNSAVPSLAGNAVAANKVDLGNGWYRCSLSVNANVSKVHFRPAFNTSTSKTTGSLLYQSAQLESGLVSTPYIETGATTAKAGILEDMPRIDYTSGPGALLLEGLRTNSFLHSEYASGNHLVGSPTITQNYATSPEGVKNAFRIQDTTGSTFKRIAQSSGGLSVSANSTYTQSLFVKKATSAVSSYGGVGFDYSGGTRQISYIIFDEYNGTMTALQSQSTLTLHDAEDYDDYWRFSISAKDTGSNTNLSINVYACLSSNGTSVSTGTKDWTGYGLQLESGNYVSSYIPSYGSAVSRSADSCSVTGVSDVIGQTEGTLFVEFITPETNSYFIHSVSDGTNNNKVQIEYNTTSDTLIGIVRVSGVTQVSISATGMTPNTRYKAAIAYKANDFVFYVNGTQEGTDTSGSVPSSMSAIHLGSQVGTFFESGEVYNATLFDTRLTNSELATLTTL